MQRQVGTAHTAVRSDHADTVQWNRVGIPVHWDRVGTAHIAEGRTGLLLHAVTRQDLWRKRRHLQ